MEVKGPSDTLSTKQKLWLDYLNRLGLNTEVCYCEVIIFVKKELNYYFILHIYFNLRRQCFCHSDRRGTFEVVSKK